MRFDPQSGHVPRSFYGAHGEKSEVRLVLVGAEPAEPADGESCEGTVDERFRQIEQLFRRGFGGADIRRGRVRPRFHSNMRRIMDLFWPGVEDEKRWRQTFLTNTVLCSANENCGRIPNDVVKVCMNTYLREELDLFPNAFIVALGSKARTRLGDLAQPKIEFNAFCYHPSFFIEKSCEPSWQSAAKAFREWLANHAEFTRK